MSQTIKITLIQSVIINSVKNETFQTGNVVKATDGKAITRAYHEQAGDEAYHERMLARAMFTQVEKLKTWFAEYLSGTGNVVEDPLIDSDEQGGSFNILLSVSDRFNLGYTKTLARLSQKYVEDRMIHLWWAASDRDKSAFYAQLAEDDLVGIMRCFNKTAPDAPEYQFADAITLKYPILPSNGTSLSGDGGGIVPETTLLQHPYLIGTGQESEITYALSRADGGKPIDDILTRADNECCTVCLDDRGRWCIRGRYRGVSVITLFSRHDDNVFARFAVRVTD